MLKDVRRKYLDSYYLSHSNTFKFSKLMNCKSIQKLKKNMSFHTTNFLHFINTLPYMYLYMYFIVLNDIGISLCVYMLPCFASYYEMLLCLVNHVYGRIYHVPHVAIVYMD